MISIPDKTSHGSHSFLGNDNPRIGKVARYGLAMLFVLFFTASVSAQSADRSAKYRLRALGMNIGEYTVKQKTVNGDVSVEAITDVKVKIIFTYRVKYIHHSLYRNGSLWSCHVQTIKNDKVNSDRRMERRGETYLLVEDGDSTLIDDTITYGGSLIYFLEPGNVPVIYNERSGKKRPVKKIADHTYILTDEKGNKLNEYEYKNGVLTRAELIHPLATIHLERLM